MGHPPDVDNTDISPDNVVEKRMCEITDTYRLVRENLQKAAERQKRQYDMRVRPALFKSGDVVWYFYPRRRQGRSAKWQRFYTGPFTVLEQLGPVSYRIQKTPRSSPFVTHVDKLKLCMRGIEGGNSRPIPHDNPVLDRTVQDDISVAESIGDLPSTDVGDNVSEEEVVNRPRRQHRRPVRYSE